MGANQTRCIRKKGLVENHDKDLPQSGLLETANSLSTPTIPY